MKNIVYIGCVESSYVILKHMLEKDIVIASSKYAKEIYAELSAQGVEKARLYLAY